jgi:hypothetical protein
VALTRRVGAELADAGGPRDATLVRHLYDLYIIQTQSDSGEIANLAREIMLDDVEADGMDTPLERDGDPAIEDASFGTTTVILVPIPSPRARTAPEDTAFATFGVHLRTGRKAVSAG